MEEEVVTIPKAEFMALLSFANKMLALEACKDRQRPSEDYIVVWGGEHEVFTGFHHELLDQEMEVLKERMNKIQI